MLGIYNDVATVIINNIQLGTLDLLSVCYKKLHLMYKIVARFMRTQNGKFSAMFHQINACLYTWQRTSYILQ